MSEMVYSTALGGGMYDCPTTIANASAEVPADIVPELSCTLVNSADTAGSPNAPLWNSVWSGTGACTELRPAEYFRLFTESYNKYNPNVRGRVSNIREKVAYINSPDS